MYQKWVNAYGDTIFCCDDGVHLDDLKSAMPTSGSVVVKVEGKAFGSLPDLLSAYESDHLNIYVTSDLKGKIPPIQRDCTIRGSAVVVIVNREYVIMVKDRTRGYPSNPGGSCELDESHEETALRECEEETGLKLSKIVPFALTATEMMHYGTKWEVPLKYFYSCVDLSPEQIEDLEKFSNEEIEWVKLVHADTLKRQGHETMADLAFNIAKCQETPYYSKFELDFSKDVKHSFK